jgi:hypothetical protein
MAPSQTAPAAGIAEREPETGALLIVQITETGDDLEQAPDPVAVR